MASVCSPARSEQAWRSFLAAVVILTGMLFSGGSGLANAASDPTLVATVPSMDLDPRTNGKVIVYNTRPGSYDIYGMSLQGGKPFPIATGKGDQVLQGISGNWVLWYELSNSAPFGAIQVTSLVTRKTVTISGSQGGVSAAISGDRVVWMSYTGRGRARQTQLFARNLTTLAPARLLATVSPGVDVWPMISGERVVWVEQDEPGMVLNGPQTEHWRLRELSLKDLGPLTIAEGSERSNCTQVSLDTVGCALQSGSLISAASLTGSTLSYVETMFNGRHRSVVAISIPDGLPSWAARQLS